MKATNIVIISLSCLSLSSSAQAPNTWIQKTNFGSLVRMWGVGFSIGTKGYLGTGGQQGGPLYRDFWQYDTLTNAWTQKANFGGTARYRAVGFSIGLKGYIGTGQDQYQYLNDFWEYDTASNAWTQKATFGGTPRLDAVGFSIGNKGYIGTGGNLSTYYNDFWEYNPTSNTWTQKANFAGSPRQGAVGLSIGNNGYIGLGNNISNRYNDFWEYTPSTNTWIQRANFSGSARAWAVGFSIASKGYIGTGEDASGSKNDFWEYDTTNNVWTQKANFGGTSRFGAEGFSIANKGFIGIGLDNVNYKNDFWAYTPTCIFPAPPTNATPPSNQNICTGQSTILSASGSGTLGWYNAPSGGNWLSGGTNYTTPILSSTTTYYVQDSTCAASLTRTSIPVNVYPIPNPTITGQTNLCVNSGNYYYTTQAGMLYYLWTVSSGGVINSGAGTNQISVSWIYPGNQTISVTYANSAGCYPPNPSVMNVTVNPLPGDPDNINGGSPVCVGDNAVPYSVYPIQNATSYTWALPPGASIASGAGTNSITVDFSSNASSGDIFVWGNNLCGNGSNSPPFSVTVDPLPGSAGIINGPADVCLEALGIVYSISTILNATGYEWTVPSGVVITSGNNTRSITTDFTPSAVSGNITVQGTNSCGTGTISPDFPVTVSPIPQTPVVTNSGDTLHSSSPTGNQWYFHGNLIQGAISQDYKATQEGYYWDVVTINGCSSDTSNHKLIILTGIISYSSPIIIIYPVPNDGQFNISITTGSEETFSIDIYNDLGIKIYEETNMKVNGSLQKAIDLRPIPNGIYTVIIENSQNQVVKKIVVNK